MAFPTYTAICPCLNNREREKKTELKKKKNPDSDHEMEFGSFPLKQQLKLVVLYANDVRYDVMLLLLTAAVMKNDCMLCLHQ